MTKTITVSDETYNKIKDQILEVKEKSKVKIEIKNRWTGSVIYSSKKETLKEAVIEAVEKKISFKYADLEYVNLKHTNLKHTNLRFANLKYADLEYANLKNADLKYADLKYANLKNANLKNANLGNTRTTYCTVNFSSSEKEQAKQFIKGLK